MTLAPLLAASPATQLHAFTAMAAVAIGVLQFVAPKGTIPHRAIGWSWVGLMVVMLVSGFFVHDVMVSPFSPNVCYAPSNSQFFNLRCAGIHLVTVYFLLVIPYAVLHARNKDVRRHRHAMMWLVFGVVVIAGIFSLDRARIMHAVVTGGP